MNTNAESFFGAKDVFIIDSNALQVGDIVLSTVWDMLEEGFPGSSFIRLKTRSKISHASLHVGGGFVIEAVPLGVRKAHVRRFTAIKSTQLRVLRPTELSEGALAQVAEQAKKLTYRPYSTHGAITSEPFLKYFRPKEKPGQFCSQLVAKSFLEAGFGLRGLMEPSEVVPENFNRLIGKSDSPLEDVSQLTHRRVSSSCLARAAQALNPELLVSANKSSTPTLSLRKAEKKVLSSARPFYRYFEETPYHLFHMFRQMPRLQARNPSISAKVDNAIASCMEQLSFSSGKVEPRVSIPLLGRPILDPHFPMIDAADTEAELDEFYALVSELRLARQWDLDDWAQTLTEVNAALEQTQLRSIACLGHWLTYDYSIIKYNYTALDDIPGKGQNLLRF